METLLRDGTSYTEISVERLVSEAGVSRSTFYAHFDDKGDLLRALAVDVIQEILDAARFWWELPADAAKADILEAMTQITAAYLPRSAVMAAVVETAAYDVAVREQFGELLAGTAAAVSQHIRSGQEQGFVHPDMDAERTGAWLTWMTERGLQQLVAPAGKAARDRLIRALTDIVWNTLYRGRR